MSRWWVLGCCVLLAACASTPPALPVPQQLLHDEAFAAPSQRPDATEVFALDDAMRRYASEVLAPRLRREGGRQRALVETLYERGGLRLDYDASHTRNAREAFAARTGNCLSLVIMTAAFARELGLSVTFQSALMEETWSRSGDLYVASGHVNLMLGQRVGSARTIYDEEQYLTIDFLPGEELRGLRTKPIDEATIVAMYMNNRAAESLVAGAVDDAYWWAREAIRQRPDFLPAYNTLGVVYLHRGRTPEAEQAFTHLLQRQPANPQALSNLALALQQQGRNAQAASVRQQLARVEPHPPFENFRLGLAALRAGEVKLARDLFAKEVDRAPYYHEFQFWLGVAELRLGEVDEARKHLQLALDNSTTRGDRELYVAKLHRLKAAGRTELH